jgi:structure-specific recognition protein 1
MSSQIVFSGIDLREGSTSVPGTLKVNSDGLAWSATGVADKEAVISADDLEEVAWMNIANTGIQLRCQKKDGDSIRFSGAWDQEAYTNLKYHTKEHFKIDLTRDKVATKGWNWGKPTFGSSNMVFDVGGNEAFEVPLAKVSQVVENKHEVALEFAMEEGEDVEQLVEMRFFVPPSQTVEEPAETTDGVTLTPAQELLAKIRDRADISNLESGGIAQFKQANFITPRGKYDLEMFDSFLTLRGQSYNYKIAYKTITRLFLLPRPGQTQLNFILSVDPPIRQGKTAYHHLIMQLPENDEITIHTNLSKTEKEKYGDQLDPEMTGKTYLLMTKIFKLLSAKKMAVPKTFRSSKGDSCVRCAYKSSEGHLFLLESSFFFITKPAMHIRFADVDSVELDRLAQASRATKSWDIMIRMSHGDVHQFNNIEKNDFEPIVHFLKSKDVKLIGDVQQEQGRKSYAEMDGFDEDDEDDEDEDESDDEDFGAKDMVGEEEVAEEYDSGHDSDSDADDVSDDDESSTKKTTKKKKRAAGKGTEKKGPKLKYGPKKNASSYFIFMEKNRAKIKEDNPDMPAQDVAKKLGEKWRAMEAADKKQYEELAEADKGRYETELTQWEEDHPDQVEAMTSQRKKAGGAKRKKASGGPKRALSAYMFFSKAKRDEVVATNPGAEFKDIGKLLGERWSKLSDEEKKPHVAEAEGDKERYRLEKEKVPLPPGSRSRTS